MVSTYIIHTSIYMPNNSCWSAFNYYLLLVQFLPPSRTSSLKPQTRTHACTPTHAHTADKEHPHPMGEKKTANAIIGLPHAYLHIHIHIVQAHAHSHCIVHINCKIKTKNCKRDEPQRKKERPKKMRAFGLQLW